MRIDRLLIASSLTVAVLAVGCSSSSDTTTATTKAPGTTGVPATPGSSTGSSTGSSADSGTGGTSASATSSTSSSRPGSTLASAPGTTRGPSGTGSTGTAPGASGNDVTVADYQFSPDTLTVKAGTLVVWTNQDEVDHWVLSRDAGVLDSQPFGQGATYQHTFTEPGTFAYYCNIHNQMKGTIVVT